VDFRPARVSGDGPHVLMILTYEVKQLIGISSMNQLEEHLFGIRRFEDHWVTARQIQEGFCQRGKGKRRGPMHRDTLADFSLALRRGRLILILEEAVRVLVKHKLVRGKTYILDATDLPTTKVIKAVGQEGGEEGLEQQRGERGGGGRVCLWYKLLVFMRRAQVGGGGAGGENQRA